MRIKAIVPILCVLGALFIGASLYIQNEVLKGEKQIESAQEKVDTGNALFSLSPATKGAGKELSSSAQKKIDEGKLTAQEYSRIAHWLLTGGVVFVILGALLFFLPKRKRRR